MAEVDFDDFEDAVYAPVRDPERAARYRLWLNYAGAVSSIALVLLLAVWGYKLAMRDVNGVPVMRALGGPMRVAPADPGGEEAGNQGLSVNAIASTGVASPVAEQLTLAPAATALTADDAAGLAGMKTSDATAVQGPDAGLAVVKDDVVAPSTADGATDATALAVADAVASAVADAPDGALVKSLVPHPRPSATGTAKTGVEVDVSSIALGTRLAQLGAFETPDEARAKWDALVAKYGAVLDGKSLVIEAAVSGGQTFYRLRALGFDGDADARRFCAVLEAGHSECTPVAQR